MIPPGSAPGALGALAAAAVLVAAGVVRGAARRAAGRRPLTRLAAPARGATPERPAAPSPAPEWFRVALYDCGVGVEAATAWRGALAAAGGVTACGWIVGGPGGAAVAAVAVGVGSVVATRVARHRGGDRIDAALPVAVEAIARSLRSGSSLRQAVAEAAEATPGVVGDDLAGVNRAVERGAGLVEALEAWAARRPRPGVHLVVAALCVGAEIGGAQARAVDAVAATLRQRLAARAEARALATQARASAVVLAVAPLAFAAVASSADARTAHFLFRTPAGVACLLAGVALDGLGALWMARITRIQPGW